MRLLLGLSIALIICLPIRADEREDTKRPITFIFSLDVGSERTLDTYLSPLVYTGPALGLRGEWLKAIPANPNHLVMAFDASLESAFMKNPIRNAQMYDIGLEIGWGMQYRWHSEKWQWKAGGKLYTNGGVLYSTRNGNNPASGRAEIGLALVASCDYPIYIGNFPILISESVTLPSLNAFFEPQYGESYYEIYLGNHDGLIHCGWWGNHFGLSNLLATTIDLGKWSLKIGYRFEMNNMWVNNINGRRYRHFFELGIVYGGIGLKNHCPNVMTKVINAVY